jgi:hypothetical protein
MLRQVVYKVVTMHQKINACNQQIKGKRAFCFMSCHAKFGYKSTCSLWVRKLVSHLQKLIRTAYET